MPFIEMYITEGALDDDAKRTLHDRVSRQVLEAEGASYDDSELAQAITWMLIHEIPTGNWSVGSEVRHADDEPRIVTRVAVPHGSLTDKKRRDIVARVNAEVVKVLGEEFTNPVKSFCLIDESLFSGGGQIYTFEQLVELLDLPKMVEEESEGAHPATAAASA
jgi:phenylpyruvate tautomerase PptA (4-oxalocrotonate tautomerase family)